MKPRLKPSFWIFFLALAVSTATPSVGVAQTLVWDTSTSPGYQNGNGTWGTDNFWTTTTSGTTLTAWTSNQTAWLGGNNTVTATPGGDFTITVSGTQVATGIRQIQNGAGNFTLEGGELQSNSFRVDRGTMTVNSVIGTYTNVANARVDFSAQPGTGNLLILGGNNTLINNVGITGATSGGGTVRLNHQNALGLGNSVFFVHNTLLDLNGFDVSGKTITVNNSRTGFLGNTAATKAFWSGNVDLDTAGNGSLWAGGTGAEVEISGIISGSNALASLDNAVLRLSGSNTHTSGISVRAGSTLIVGHANALGSTTAGTLISSTGTLDLNGFNIGNEAVTLQQNTSRLVNNNASTAANVSGNISFEQVGATREIGGAGNMTLAGVIASTTTGGFSKTGAGTLTLSGANTYSGTTTVSAGTLALSGAGTLGNGTGALTVSGGNVDLGGLSRNVGAFTLSTGTLANGTLTATSYALTDAGSISASLAGSGGLTKSGAGTATLSGSNSYSGTTTISGGLTSFLRMDNANALGSGTSVQYSATSGLDLNGFDVSSKNITVAAGQTGILDNTSATKSVWSGNVDVGSSGSGTLRGGGTGAEVEISGVISGSNAMSTHDNGVLRLTGNNTYSGGTSVRENSVLIVGHENALGAKTGTAFIGTTGTLDLNGFDVGSQPITLQQNTSRLVNNNTSTAANVDGAITFLRVGSLRQIGGDGDLTLGGAIGSDANVNGFTKVGTGVLTLGGTNTYTGATAVNAGALLVNGSHSGTGLMSVASGARIGGTGSLAGGLTIASGGLFVFNPADSTLDVSGAVSLDNSFSVASLVNPDGSAISWGSVADSTYSLIGLTSSTFNSITNFGVGAAAPIGVGRTAYFTNTSESGGLTLVVVPEPGGLALAGLGIAAAAWALRRRHS